MKKYIFKANNMKKYMFTVMASLLWVVATAQTTLTPQQEREFYQKAYNVVREYGRLAAVNNEEKEYMFTKLFERDDMEICNDLMSLSSEPALTVSNYVKILSSSASGVMVEVKNVEKGVPTQVDGVWQLPLTLEKHISFLDKCDIFFDSREFLEGGDIRLSLVLTYDPLTGRCYISELIPTDGVREFPQDYRVLVKRDERDNKLVINGEDIVKNPNWNEYEQVLLLNGKKDKVLYEQNPVDLVKNEIGCGPRVHAKYADKSWRLRVNGSFALSGFNKVSDAGVISTSKNGEMGFGLDIGYMLPSKGKLRTTLFAGIGISANNLTMTMNAGEYSLLKAKDIDGDEYTRFYNVKGNGIVQEMKATDIAVPVYLDLEYKFGAKTKFSVYGDLGVKLQTTAENVTINSDSYEAKGLYEKYDNLTITDMPVLHFDTYTKGMQYDADGATKSMAFDGLLGLGLRYHFSQTLMADVGVQAQIGLSNSWKADKKESVFSYECEDKSFDKVNLLRVTSGIKHSAFKLNISLIYNF